MSPCVFEKFTLEASTTTYPKVEKATKKKFIECKLLHTMLAKRKYY